MHAVGAYLVSLFQQIATLDVDLIILAVLIVCCIVVLESVSIFARKKRTETGIEAQTPTVSIDGSTACQVKHYVSTKQGLAGRPDALIIEDGYIIPVERKPLANKIRDRYVAQILVYMRLIEEFEGKRPPYGYLILGPKCRKFKIENSSQRQAWLQRLIDEMQAILHGGNCIPAPHSRKCCRCDVRDACAHCMQAHVIRVDTQAGATAANIRDPVK
jgi:CRISPR/Cas system-associated exonuclease Cas4 (RecB family)